jgi:hypothetical protein
VLAPEQSVLVCGQAGRALDVAHRHGLVHRDVKPGNILVEHGADEDEPDHIYLTDFGITKHAASRSGLTATGEFMGTIDYIAPEQIQGRPVDGRADIYSLGCVLYECLTGRVPFAKDVDAAVIWAHVEEMPTTPSALHAGLPSGIDEVLGKALAKDPADRYATCREFVGAARAALGVTAATGALHTATALATTAGAGAVSAGHDTAPQPAQVRQPAATDQPPPAPPAGPPRERPPGDLPAPPHRPHRRRGLLAGLGALVLIIAAAGGWLIWHNTSTGSPTPAMSSMPSNPATHSPLVTALTNANKATRLLPLNTCHPQSTTVVTCTQPNFAVQTVTFRTYPSLTALYKAYVADVRKLGNTKGSSIKVNFGDCSRSVSGGEVSWNHNFRHPKIYSLAQSISGKLKPGPQAAGRVFCTISDSGQYQLVWTEDGGHLLATMAGGPHDSAWLWWRTMHHNIFLPGTPMRMKM